MYIAKSSMCRFRDAVFFEASGLNETKSAAFTNKLEAVNFARDNFEHPVVRTIWNSNVMDSEKVSVAQVGQL